MVPIGWSVGDLFAAIGIIKKLVKALDETKGAKSDYQQLMQDIYNLERVLTAVKSLNIDQSSSSEASTLWQAIRECRICIDTFLNSIKKYQSLTSGKSTPRGQIRKLKWALGHKDDVQKFRETLGKRTASLNLLLDTIHLGHALSLEEKADDRFHEKARLLDKVQASISTNDAEQLQLLRQIEGLLRVESSAKADRQPPAPKSFSLPFKLNGAPLAPAFVQRSEVMQAIEEQLLPISEDQQAVLVLQGMGGMGKSQIAREYACKHKDDYTAIFWVDAKSENTLKNGIAGIAERIGLNDVLDEHDHVNKDEPNIVEAVSAVHKWLNEDRNTRWLLILDNVDRQVQPDLDGDGREISSPIEDFNALPYVPLSSQGTLLVTSRSSYLARMMGGISIPVDQMTPNEGLEVICKLSKRMTDEPGAEALVERLGCYPLALSQCGRYICETQVSFGRYLSRYETRLKSLLKQNPSIREYQNGSITATLGLSYEALKARNPTAAALLAFCGCLDNANILWGLFGY